MGYVSVPEGQPWRKKQNNLLPQILQPWANGWYPTPMPGTEKVHGIGRKIIHWTSKGVLFWKEDMWCDRFSKRVIEVMIGSILNLMVCFLGCLCLSTSKYETTNSIWKTDSKMIMTWWHDHLTNDYELLWGFNESGGLNCQLLDSQMEDFSPCFTEMLHSGGIFGFQKFLVSFSVLAPNRRSNYTPEN